MQGWKERERERRKKERELIRPFAPFFPFLPLSFSLSLSDCFSVHSDCGMLERAVQRCSGCCLQSTGDCRKLQETPQECVAKLRKKEREREERGEERTHYLDRGESRGGAVRALRNTERCRRATEDERGKETRGRWLSPLLAFLSRFSPPLLLTLCFLHSVCSGHVNTVPCQR